MKISQGIPVLAVAAVAGAAGYWAGRMAGSAEKTGAETEPGMAGTASPGPRGAGAQAGGAALLPLVREELRTLLGPGPVVPDEKMRGEVMRVLLERDPVRRAAAVAVLMDNMTEGNADGFRRAFLESTAQSGRRHDAEWGLMLRQYGKTLGQEAMERLAALPQDARQAMEGWAAADPEAARQWLSPGHADYPAMRAAMLNGIALADPRLAFGLVLDDPDAPLNPEWLVKAGIQGAGTDGVTAALQQAMDAAKPEAVDSPAFSQLFGTLADAVFRQKWEAGDSAAMLPWLESLKGQPFLTEDMIGHGAMDVILQGNLPAALDWLDRMESPPASGAVVDRLRQSLSGNAALLAAADAATLERVIARFPSGFRPSSHALEELARATAPHNPAHAARLQSAAEARRLP